MLNNLELARALGNLRGEWGERTAGGDFTVQTIEQLPLGESTIGDLVLFPARNLGDFCETHLLRPVRKTLLAGDSVVVSSIFPAIREHEMVYGQQTMALPLGSVVPLVFAKRELVNDAGILNESAVGSATFAMPLEGRYAAYSLLVRAARYGTPPRGNALLFETDTMKPLVDTPPYIRALEEIVATAKSSDPAMPTLLQTADVVKLGKFPAALLWPVRSSETKAAVPLFPALLPSGIDYYDQRASEWKKRTDESPVVLVGSGGALAAVTKKTRNASSAFRLLQWLASPENAMALGRAGEAIAMCRQNTPAAGDDWLGGEDRIRGTTTSKRLAQAMSTSEYFAIPRLPGVDEYLDTLSEAVRNAVAGEISPADALASVAAAWEQITERRGRDAQIAANKRSLNRIALPLE